jgi:aspartyl/asparaginyl-tRNA synthetase
MKTAYRDITCADASLQLVGREVSLAGWVHRRRDMGQLIFLDLRDRYGITQVVIDAKESPEAHAAASEVRNEFVLRVRGTIAKRLEGTENPKLATGAVELRAARIQRTPQLALFWCHRPTSKTIPGLKAARARWMRWRAAPVEQPSTRATSSMGRSRW